VIGGPAHPKLGEAVLPVELLQLTLGNCQLEGLVLCEVRWLDLRVPLHISSSVVDEEGVFVTVIFLVVMAFVFVLAVIGQDDSKLTVEEAHVIEVARLVARVKLPSSEREPDVRVEGESRIIAQIPRQDEPAALHLIMALA
jgi:hypothetical protein